MTPQDTAGDGRAASGDHPAIEFAIAANDFLTREYRAGWAL